jgi:hypothetical protein
VGGDAGVGQLGIGVRAVCAAVGIDGEEEVGREFERADDGFAGSSSLPIPPFSALLSSSSLSCLPSVAFETNTLLSQTPGSFLFVYTLAIRPSVTYTAWITYFVTGLLQGTLLILCLMWKRRQARLGVDDWGRKVEVVEGVERAEEGERRRLLE